MFGFLKKKKAPPPKKVKKPVDIKKVSAQYKVVLKQERFRKDVRQIKKKNVIDFHNLRYYLQKQKPHSVNVTSFDMVQSCIRSNVPLVSCVLLLVLTHCVIPTRETQCLLLRVHYLIQ